MKTLKIITAPGSISKTQIIVLFVAFLFISMNGQTQNKRNQSDEERKASLVEMADRYSQNFHEKKSIADSIAREKDWIIRKEMTSGQIIELQYIDKYGIPQYNSTHNLNAARTTGTNQLWAGGTTGLNLDGSGFTLGEWDGGAVRGTHQEFMNGTTSRINQADGAMQTSDHSTHVAGTLIAQGIWNQAQGMASAANLDAYDWNNDESEMIQAAGNGLTLSNHSYGSIRGWMSETINNQTTWYWYGNILIDPTGQEDYLFGFYNDKAQELDNIASALPHYLILKSAGNDRNDTHSGSHWMNIGGTWIQTNMYHEQDGGTDGYDCLPPKGTAKNILTVGAVGQLINGYNQPADVVCEAFSTWGPTDDGRIKPDIVANGDLLTSTIDDHNTAYAAMNGTSMSTPNVTGSLALLQQHYQNNREGQMSAAVLKGLTINTANEAGPDDGPDYMHGWGLFNAVGAANLITLDNNEGGLINEHVLLNGETDEFEFINDGTDDINVTICWTDPPGTPPADALNPTNLMLVNDLFVRVTTPDGSVIYPWVLNPSSPSAAATKGNNTRDNVETVNIQNPASGTYKILVSHYGSLLYAEQSYALIVSGLHTRPDQSYCEARSGNHYESIRCVIVGDISNTSGYGPGGYADYTGLVTEMEKGSNYNLTLIIGNPYPGDDAQAWVDWNQDGDFDDSGEGFLLGSGVGPYFKTITVPQDAVSGYTTMRVRLVDYGALSPCGNTDYGETEDYTIRVVGAFDWTGALSDNWHNPGNWSGNAVPGPFDDVLISDVPNRCVIHVGDAQCNNMIVEGGGDNYLRVFDHTLYVAGSLTVHGEIRLDWGARVTIYENTNWESGSTATFWSNSMVWTYGDWNINPGANHQIDFGSVNFLCPNTSKIRCKEAGSYFNDISVKSLGGNLLVDSETTVDLGIKGNLEIEANSLFNYDCSQTLKLSGDFINTGSYEFDYGTLEFNGISQSIDNHQVLVNPGYFFNVTINNYDTLNILNKDIDVNGDLTIENGVLDPHNNTIYVGRSWKNMVGPLGFIEGLGTVVFDGMSSPQYCHTDHFNILEVKKQPLSLLLIDGHDVSCNKYNWESGGVLVMDGSFTANDLADDGLFGIYIVFEGCEMNLSNYGGRVDLNCNMQIYDGIINIYGGSDLSNWPYAADAAITINGGILDFHDQEIYLNNNTGFSL
nr:S8 family serine peptidase [Bacteroidota bacterium]